MSLTARQCRALDSIERQLGAREPKLASMFAMFTRLTKDELLPTIEAIEVRPRLWRAGLIARVRSRRRRRRASGLAPRVVNVTLVPFIVLSLLVTALVMGGHGSPANRCNRVASYHSLGVANVAGGNCGSWLTQTSHRHPQ
jgi:hypothetical protein